MEMDQDIAEKTEKIDEMMYQEVHFSGGYPETLMFSWKQYVSERG